MAKISTVIITYNEEQNLRELLPLLYWCDEIIIVDSGSTDQTLDVCRSYNCKIFYRKFEGYGAQKRYALSLAENDWILSLDADEILSNELVAEIKQEMISPSADGYYIPMVFVFMGKEFRYGKENWRYFLRLFNRKRGDFSDDIVHEQISVDGSCKKLSGNIYHYSYRNFAQYFEKFNRYSSLAAEIAYTKGKRRSVIAVLFALPVNFLKYYLLERNFLNGWSGFYWSVFSSFYHFTKYIKLRELYARTSELPTYRIGQKTNLI
jgi:glycosyltransferase involved in cell wall biosynthesis